MATHYFSLTSSYGYGTDEVGLVLGQNHVFNSFCPIGASVYVHTILLLQFVELLLRLYNVFIVLKVSLRLFTL